METKATNLTWSLFHVLVFILIAIECRGHEEKVNLFRDVPAFTSLSLSCGATAMISASGAGYQWRSVPDGALECTVRDSVFSCLLGQLAKDGEDAHVDISLQANTSLSISLKGSSANALGGVSLNSVDLASSSLLLGEFCNDALGSVTADKSSALNLTRSRENCDGGKFFAHSPLNECCGGAQFSAFCACGCLWWWEVCLVMCDV